MSRWSAFQRSAIISDGICTGYRTQCLKERLTDRQFADIEYGLKKIIQKDEDSVRFYVIRSQDLVKVGNMGIEKADQCTII